MSDDETIHVEEENVAGDDAGKGQERVWSEEFKIATDELVAFVRKVSREANVRRIMLRRADGRTLLDIPLWLGVTGVALLPPYAALGMIAAMLADISIVVERVEPVEKGEAA